MDRGEPPATGLGYLPPPYTKEKRLRGEPSRLTRGSLLVLNVGDPALQEPRVLASWIRRLRKRLAVPVFVRLRPSTGAAQAVITSWAIRAGAVTVLSPGQSVAPIARDMLPCPPDLARAFLDWVDLHRTPTAASRRYVEIIVRNAQDVPSVRDLLRDHGVPPRTARHRLRHEGLPAPGAWHLAARLVGVHFELQRDPHAAPWDPARRLGYKDPSTLARQTRSWFGVTLAEAHLLLGLEWRLREWWQRALPRV